MGGLHPTTNADEFLAAHDSASERRERGYWTGRDLRRDGAATSSVTIRRRIDEGDDVTTESAIVLLEKTRQAESWSATELLFMRHDCAARHDVDDYVHVGPSRCIRARHGWRVPLRDLVRTFPSALLPARAFVGCSPSFIEHPLVSWVDAGIPLGLAFRRPSPRGPAAIVIGFWCVWCGTYTDRRRPDGSVPPGTVPKFCSTRCRMRAHRATLRVA